MSDIALLPYRPCVGIMLVNAVGRVFVGRRIDGGHAGGASNSEGDFWQMPQGGIDPGEDLLDAGYRELFEETGVARGLARIVAQAREELLYDLPEELIGKLWKGRYRGQRQQWLLMRFTGEDSDIRLDAHQPAEFSDWRWVAPEALPGLIVPFKREVYRAVVAQFAGLI